MLQVAATVHFPYMTAWPDRAMAADREATLGGFETLRRAFEGDGVETLVVLTSEHIVNLQPRLAPAFAVGIGETHAAFPEPQFNLSPAERRGDPEVAEALVRDLYDAGFDPAHASELRLDHGTTLPLAQMKLDAQVAIVPVIINSLFPPLPTLRRCAELGAAIAASIERSTFGRRIGILATGGLSHTVGAPGMERNHPDFDADFVAALAAGDLARACSHSDARLDAFGNGTHEIRNWVAAAGAAQPRRARVVTSIAYVRGWDTGVHQLLWEAS